MKYTTEELAFILYNNLSVDGVVNNFIPTNINPFELVKIDNILENFRKIFNGQKFIEINRNEVNETAEDIFVDQNDIKSVGDKLLNIGIDGFELEYLLKRGIGYDIINEWKIRGLSQIKDYNNLVILNATCHPVLKTLLSDGIEGGGIVIPLFKNNELINCAIRKISDVGKLKYSLACPDIDVWGLEDIEEASDVWITEGLFDMMALRSIGIKSVSVSSAMWSSIQLYRLIKMNPKSITIFCDHDSIV